jgi:lysophospholipase L1-like esterase
MSMRLNGNKLLVSPGKCWVNDRLLEVTAETALDIEPPSITAVKDQSLEISADGLAGISSKTILADLKASASDPVPLAGILVPGSVHVKAGKDGAVAYKRGVDYAIDERWGAIAGVTGGAIKKGQAVYVDYKYSGRRLDTVVMSNSGKLSLLHGIAAKSAPVPPHVPAGFLAIANVYVPPTPSSIGPEIIPIKTLQATPVPNEVREANRKALSKTLAKLNAGEPLNIVFWGDSITAGADSSAPDKTFTSQFLAALRARFPAARVSTSTLGIGGTNTNHRLPGLEKDVLSRKPDLVIVEFVNDLMVPAPQLEANYAKIIGLMKQSGAELILCTPHLPAPNVMAAASWQAVGAKPYIKLVRRTATSSQVGLADVALRWEGLRREGLRPDFMLVDEVIHPNDRGHALYAEELMKCFD